MNVSDIALFQCDAFVPDAVVSNDTEINPIKNG